MLKALITDIDGTLTDDRRRLSLHAVEVIRRLIDSGIPVVFASGNPICFIDTLSKMIGTDGDVIAENGGVYRHGYIGDLHVEGDQKVCLSAYQKIVDYFQLDDEKLRLYGREYRYSDVAFARDVSTSEINRLLEGMPVQVIDTGFAIHIQSCGLSKGIALVKLANIMGLTPENFLAVGDSVNDVSMLKLSGVAVVPSNASPEARAAADDIINKPFGDGTAEAILRYLL